ncbi:AAA family ATPase [Ramlibacter sp.]|uniref:AAA family ATPase n=1 Tax=Ramlibacter sp. TaxID=1917967 RepID=UPI002B759651|nr:AAA family ATPase [Ramlibacter sp.]HWI81739.1 AAA family ATPase [Ramlibacter sp.]
MDDLPFERGDGEAQRLAAGFAEHVVRWAQRAGGDAAHLETLRRAARMTSLATSDGHVCILLSELAREGGDAAALRGALLASGVVGSPARPASLPLILDEDGRLYLHRYFDYEVRLARRLVQAAKTPPREVTPASRDLLDSLFAPQPDGVVDWQKVAAALALRGGLTVISGGPGTGKTTTVVNLLACLLAQEPHLRIALAAPTGKAAARMAEAIRQRADHLPPELRARLPQESFTIHRLLGANPGQGRFTHDAANPLAIDALVVDEASMLDLALAARLLEAVPAPARIILLGDKDQLAAVEAGAVFAELSADPTLTDACRRDLAGLCGYPPERIAPPAPVQASPLPDVAVWLTKNYRFAADSAIGKLARYVNEGRAQEALALLRASRVNGARPPGAAPQAVGANGPTAAVAGAAPKGRSARKASEDGASLSLFPELDAGRGSTTTVGSMPAQGDASVRWLDPEQGDDVLDAIVDGYADYFETVRRDPADVHAITRAFAEFRVLCAVREGSSGSVWVNEQVTRHARQALAGIMGDRAHDPRSPWYAGRPVMVLRNDYVNKLFNGDIGIALPAGDDLAVVFPDGEGSCRAVPIARMPPHETAYAMTVHKAQGSEFDAVLLLLPPQQTRVAVGELLYTAVTRAKRRVMLSARSESVAQAIRSRLTRHSGLMRRVDAGPGGMAVR